MGAATSVASVAALAVARDSGAERRWLLVEMATEVTPPEFLH
jgi:hypothetical protein